MPTVTDHCVAGQRRNCSQNPSHFFAALFKAVFVVGSDDDDTTVMYLPSVRYGGRPALGGRQCPNPPQPSLKGGGAGWITQPHLALCQTPVQENKNI